MLDTHIHPENWGIRPILISIGKYEIPSYSVMLILALVLGFVVYWLRAKKNKSSNENTYLIAIAALAGGIIGAKIPIWIINFKLIISNLPDPYYILSGRTITGGLIGGVIAVFIAKKRLGIEERKGHIFAPAVALGVAIGRLGCFFAGCCYGTPTGLPWGVDFGDGIARHPTQLYEALFCLLLMIYFLYSERKGRVVSPGRSWTIFLNSYFGFRFFIEFIRVNEIIYGLSFYQWISIIALLFINRNYIIRMCKSFLLLNNKNL